MDGRSGLAVLGGGSGSKVVISSDWDQYMKAQLAWRRGLASLLGGPAGLLTGGVMTTGSSYPAFAAVVADDSGECWYLGSAAATAMTFLVTSGSCTAYLVPKTVTGRSPLAAIGGIGDFQILVQLTASTPPAHSLALGHGTVVASAFTTWTETAVRLQGVKGDKGDTGETGATGAKGDKGDKGDTGAAGGGMASLTVSADTGTPQECTSVLSLLGGGLVGTQAVSDDTVRTYAQLASKLGAPVSGDYPILDAAGALYAPVTGYAGTWHQRGIGILDAAPVATDFASGSIPTGYLYYDASAHLLKRWDGAAWQTVGPESTSTSGHVQLDFDFRSETDLTSRTRAVYADQNLTPLYWRTYGQSAGSITFSVNRQPNGEFDESLLGSGTGPAVYGGLGTWSGDCTGWLGISYGDWIVAFASAAGAASLAIICEPA